MIIRLLGPHFQSATSWLHVLKINILVHRHNVVHLISSGFADIYKVYIQSILEDLLKQVHGKLQMYCSGDVSVKPRFYHLSERLALSEKVTTCTCMPCTYKLLGDSLNSYINFMFPFLTGT